MSRHVLKSNDIAIKLSGVSKRYIIHHENLPAGRQGPRSWSGSPAAGTRSFGFTQKNAKLLFRALKDVNLTGIRCVLKSFSLQ